MLAACALFDLVLLGPALGIREDVLRSATILLADGVLAVQSDTKSGHRRIWACFGKPLDKFGQFGMCSAKFGSRGQIGSAFGQNSAEFGQLSAMLGRLRPMSTIESTKVFGRVARNLGYARPSSADVDTKVRRAKHTWHQTYSSKPELWVPISGMLSRATPSSFPSVALAARRRVRICEPHMQQWGGGVKGPTVAADHSTCSPTCPGRSQIFLQYPTDKKGLSHEPEIGPCRELDQDLDHMILICSDGVWDVIPPPQAPGAG